MIGDVTQHKVAYAKSNGARQSRPVRCVGGLNVHEDDMSISERGLREVI